MLRCSGTVSNRRWQQPILICTLPPIVGGKFHISWSNWSSFHMNLNVQVEMTSPLPHLKTLVHLDLVPVVSLMEIRSSWLAETTSDMFRGGCIVITVLLPPVRMYVSLSRHGIDKRKILGVTWEYYDRILFISHIQVQYDWICGEPSSHPTSRF